MSFVSRSLHAPLNFIFKDGTQTVHGLWQIAKLRTSEIGLGLALTLGVYKILVTAMAAGTRLLNTLLAILQEKDNCRRADSSTRTHAGDDNLLYILGIATWPYALIKSRKAACTWSPSASASCHLWMRKYSYVTVVRQERRSKLKLKH